MPQEKSKVGITARLNAERRRLEKNLAELNREEMTLPGVVGEWSVKDVLAHLADWEAHMLVWMAAARRGEAVSNPDPGLTWKQFDAMNQRIYTAHRDQTLDEVLMYFHATHSQFMEMVAAMPEDEMLERGRYAFIGKGAVYDWLNAYANHDAWGKREIRAWIKGRTA